MFFDINIVFNIYMYKVMVMYKIFIDSSSNELIIKLSKEVEKSLLANDNCIVYRNNERESRYSAQDLDLDAYIYIKGDAAVSRA